MASQTHEQTGENVFIFIVHWDSLSQMAIQLYATKLTDFKVKDRNPMFWLTHHDNDKILSLYTRSAQLNMN